MKYDVKERMIKRLCEFSETVNGFPATQENKMYWYLLRDSKLRAVYKKWKTWAENQTNEIMDKFTLPDIRLKLDKDYTIIGCEAITQAGAFFLLHNAIIEKNYDSVSFPDLWVETNSLEDENES